MFKLETENPPPYTLLDTLLEMVITACMYLKGVVWNRHARVNASSTFTLAAFN